MPLRKRVTDLVRITNSMSGNPRWKVLFEDGTWARTAADAQVGFTAEAYDGQEVAVTLDPRGEITQMAFLDQGQDFGTRLAGATSEGVIAHWSRLDQEVERRG